MQRLRIPAFSESNLFDTLVDTAERMQRDRGPQSDRSTLYWYRHFQQADLRQNPQSAAKCRSSNLRHRPDADLCAN